MRIAWSQSTGRDMAVWAGSWQPSQSSNALIGCWCTVGLSHVKACLISCADTCLSYTSQQVSDSYNYDIWNPKGDQRNTIINRLAFVGSRISAAYLPQGLCLTPLNLTAPVACLTPGCFRLLAREPALPTADLTLEMPAPLTRFCTGIGKELRDFKLSDWFAAIGEEASRDGTPRPPVLPCKNNHDCQVYSCQRQLYSAKDCSACLTALLNV